MNEFMKNKAFIEATYEAFSPEKAHCIVTNAMFIKYQNNICLYYEAAIALNNNFYLNATK